MLNRYPFHKETNWGGTIMKEIDIHKAQSIDGKEIPNINISIMKEIPKNYQQIEDLQKFFDIEGKKICDTLFESLPGGTIDALFLEMMKRKQSKLTIPF